MIIFKNNDYINVTEEFVHQLQNKKLIYEVIRVIDSIPLFLKDHILRLNNSLALLNKKEIKEENIKLLLDKLIKESRITNGNVKIVYDFKDIFGFFIPHKYPSKEQYSEGVKTILYFGERNNPNAKVMDITFRENVNKKIEENGAFEAILINNEGNITEGSKSNIFLVKDNTLYTSLSKQVLPGITRKKIFEICSTYGIKITEKDISYKELNSFQGLFISGTSPKILPIKAVDNITFKSSENKLIINLSKYYDLLIDKYLREENHE